MYFTYPALFDPDEVQGYTVTFPDLPGCITEGDTIDEAYKNAVEALALYLEPDDDNPQFPKASDISELQKEASRPSFYTLVRADVDTRTSVRKNLTIPSWLNRKAEQANINFSQTLQEALKEKLNVG